ncbi:MAG: BCCT family transporter [Bacteroidota bacterium]
MTKRPDKKIRLNGIVFFPTLLFLLSVIVYSLVDNVGFLTLTKNINNWILDTFGWLFTWSAFGLFVLLIAVYFSPIAKRKIGGPTAKPILNKWKWFAITLCTTIAAGLIFWGTAEPLYHLYQPPSGLQIAPNSSEASAFALSILFMHWSFLPYGIYTITGLVFALAYYNFQQPFNVGALFFPFIKIRNHKSIFLLDIICLAALISGMAASLGMGIFALVGGLKTIFAIEKSSQLMGLIGLVIVLTFLLSTASGLKRGIALLSTWNTLGFFFLAGVILILGPTLSMLKIGGQGILDYGTHFLSRSTNVGVALDDGWLKNWTIFYFANWFAWAPVSALFLGRLSVGYTVRDFINFNLFFPSLFTCGWMIIFGGTSMALDQQSQGTLYQILTEQGEENVLYHLLTFFSNSQWLSLFALVLIFFSYVTIADSNVSAMSAISTTGIQPETPEAPIWIKTVWGSLIGIIAWVMISSAGIDGIRMLCVLGGFPALFIITTVGLGTVKLLLTKKY